MAGIENGKLVLGESGFMDKYSFDLILMDVRLPGMSGLEAVREIRKNNKTIKIIVQIAYAMKAEAKAMEAGCDVYISVH